MAGVYQTTPDGRTAFMCLPNYLYSSPIGAPIAVKALCQRIKKEDSYLVVDSLSRKLPLHNRKPARCEVINTKYWGDWFAAIDKDARNQVRQSERRGVTVRPANLEDALFVATESANIQKVRLDVAWFTKMVEFSVENGVTLGAYVNDKPIGIVIVYKDGRNAHLVKNSSLQTFRQHRPNHALYSAAVKWCSENGVYSLNTGGSPKRSLTDFKRSLNTKPKVYHWYSK